MGTRIAVWLDDELEERLNTLLAKMAKKPGLQDLGITKSAVIKAAITKGLPFLELEHMAELTDLEDMAKWVDYTAGYLEGLREVVKALREAGDIPPATET
jgi:predicted DNA-binding protein